MKKYKKKRLRMDRVFIVAVIVLALCFGIYKGAKILFFDNNDKNQVVESDYQRYKSTVVIDPGHGGKDGGAINKSLYEKDVSLKAAFYLGKELEKQNIRVIYTRTKDIHLDEDKRTDLNIRARSSQQYHADYFISLHVNDFAGKKNVSGFEIYVKDQNSQNFAKTVAKHLEELNYSQNRGMFDAPDLRVLKQNAASAILIELGYIRGNDFNYLKDDKKLAILSQTIANGIVEEINNK